VTTLQGERVLLRPVEDGDVEALRAIHTTPEVAAWWGIPAEAFPRDVDPETTRWVIVHEGAAAGLIDATEEDDPHFRQAQIDLFVDPPRHRRGLASDAIRTVVRHLAEDRGHHHVTIDPALDNRGAIRCYETVGFRRVGVLRKDWRDFHTDEWRDALLLEMVVGKEAMPRGGVLELADGDRSLVFTFDDLLRFHGGGSPGGVAIAFKALERALALLSPDAPAQRSDISVRTAFGGPGARDAFECALRAVSGGRYVVEPGLARPELGVARERFVFVLEAAGRSVTLVLREGIVDAEMLELARAPSPSADDERRLETLKDELADRALSLPAEAVFD
jgi:RimJ/RimL family protein N-acetyltransferase